EEPLAAGGLAFTVAEEGLGNLHGAVAACETLQPEAFIALEGHGLDRVFVDAVGSIRARITISGPGGHSWVDRGRPNAIHALTEVAHDLLAGDAPESFVNIGGIAGGRSINAIADEASLSIDAWRGCSSCPSRGRCRSRSTPSADAPPAGSRARRRSFRPSAPPGRSSG